MTARRERYPHPGALPEVEPGTLEDDLARRDFTVNAIAMDLGGALHAAPGGLEDLAGGAIRVLHDKSFNDDPTRLLRAVRYETRLGFAIEPHTEALAREARAAGALDTVSAPASATSCSISWRSRARRSSVVRLGELGIANAAPMPRRRRAAHGRRAWRSRPPTPGATWWPSPRCASTSSPAPCASWLDALALTAPERDIVVRAATGARELASELATERAPSELATLLGTTRPKASPSRRRSTRRRRRTRGAGWTSCATCASRSPATT